MKKIIEKMRRSIYQFSSGVCMKIIHFLNWGTPVFPPGLANLKRNPDENFGVGLISLKSMWFSNKLKRLLNCHLGLILKFYLVFKKILKTFSFLGHLFSLLVLLIFIWNFDQNQKWKQMSQKWNHFGNLLQNQIKL